MAAGFDDVAAVRRHTPRTFEEAAEAIAASAAEGLAVRPVGAGTKLHWGCPAPPAAVELQTGGLDQIREHNTADLTAVLDAGVPLAAAQEQFARAGQMLAIDPPPGFAPSTESAQENSATPPRGVSPTIGGVFATGDSGPLRHRYGAPRDLVLGMTVALADGTLARSGDTVITNAAGYDVARLFTGSFGTLGVILSVTVRLHPLAAAGATALGATADPGAQAAAVRALAASGLELEALDIAWRAGRGGVLARCAGGRSAARAARAAALMRDAGLKGVDVTEEDAPLWIRQRAGQRSASAALVRVGARPSQLPDVIRAAEHCDATVVGRGAVGTSYVELAGEAVTMLRAELPPDAVSVLLDAPDAVRRAVDVWGESEGPSLALMRRIKQRFDPDGICNPGVFVGGI